MTIVVLLILAGITIVYVLGDNGVFGQASKAKINTELAKIEEKAGIIYSDKLLEKVANNSNEKPTMQEIVDELQKQGDKIEQVAIDGDAVTGISLDKENLTLDIEATEKIKATIEKGRGVNYYAVVNGKYYKMNYNNDYITIDRTPSEILSEGGTNIPVLTVTSGNEDIAIANIDNTTNVITVTAKKGGTTAITISSKDGNIKPAICTIMVTSPKLADIVNKTQEKNTEVEDENGNKVVIPGGFRVLPHGAKSDNIDEVIYNYDANHKPCVQDGIVIADEEDNQFVWIPVGEIKNKDNTITTITLGRYEDFETKDANGNYIPKQDANDYIQSITINSWYQELISGNENVSAKDLGDFISKTKANGGYYLARYEVSQGTDEKIKSQYDKVVYVNMTQPYAAWSARKMYNSNCVESDLVNSYAWDTAIIFIQKYSQNSNYANKYPEKGILLNTGKAGDKVCNIHDMASNCFEWSTEHSSKIIDGIHEYCCNRGGCWQVGGSPSVRGYMNSITGLMRLTFRTVCYIK